MKQVYLYKMPVIGEAARVSMQLDNLHRRYPAFRQRICRLFDVERSRFEVSKGHFLGHSVWRRKPRKIVALP